MTIFRSTIKLFKLLSFVFLYEIMSWKQSLFNFKMPICLLQLSKRLGFQNFFITDLFIIYFWWLPAFTGRGRPHTYNLEYLHVWVEPLMHCRLAGSIRPGLEPWWGAEWLEVKDLYHSATGTPTSLPLNRMFYAVRVEVLQLPVTYIPCIAMYEEHSWMTYGIGMFDQVHV